MKFKVGDKVKIIAGNSIRKNEIGVIKMLHFAFWDYGVQFNNESYIYPYSGDEVKKVLDKNMQLEFSFME